MEYGLNFVSFLYYLLAINVIVYFNISPIICYDVILNNKDSNDFLIQSNEQEHHHRQHPITFTSYDNDDGNNNAEKFSWRQKSFNTNENEQQLPSSTIVGLQQQSKQEYNSWKKQNHYKHDNENENFNTAKHIHGITKSNDDDNYEDIAESNDIYGIPKNDKRNGITTDTQRYVNQPKASHEHLCEIKEQIVSLDTSTHIYRPDHYVEKECTYPTASNPTLKGVNRLCSSKTGFECQTKISTIFLTRKLKGTDCWEPDYRVVPSGCECMHRKSIDISKIY